MIHRGRPPAGRPVTAVAGRRSIRPAFVACGNPRRGFAVTGGTGPRCHIRMIERCRNPRRRGVTDITGPRRQPAFVPRRNTARDRGVVTIGTGRRRDDGVIHRGRPPAGRPVTAVAGPRSHPAFVACGNTRREHAVTGRTGSRLHRAVVIPAGHQPPRSAALLMARIAGSPATIHVPRWLSLRHRSVMTARAGPWRNSIVRKKCGRPIRRTVATVTVDAGR